MGATLRSICSTTTGRKTTALAPSIVDLRCFVQNGAFKLSQEHIVIVIRIEQGSRAIVQKRVLHMSQQRDQRLHPWACRSRSCLEASQRVALSSPKCTLRLRLRSKMSILRRPLGLLQQ